ncbi:MAG: hypothetical protein HKN75_04880, partial [Bacteroidia bacterium]|nr:hypothetical protein [Bacteroidia bacterium]
MKLNFTCLLTLLFSVCIFTTNAQILNQPAAWPNASWTVSGTYTAAGLVNDPTSVSTFLFDDDLAGNGSTDDISAESPIIDLTAANAGGESWVSLASSYVYREISGSLNIEYWDADAGMYVAWESISANSTNTDYQICNGQAAFTSIPLDIGGFTGTQLSGFKYRFNYNDAGGWNWGFCMASPVITSAAPPSCLDPINLGVANLSPTGADLMWTGSGTVVSYNLALDTAGFVFTGSGTSVLASPYAASGLMSGTAYDFYVQSVCGPDSSNWVGPFTFSTPADYCAGDKFYDTGGANGNYSSNETTVTTICPDNPGDVILATFTAFDIETNWDALYVFDGASTASPLIASANGPTQSNFPAGGYYGTSNPGPFVSTDAS